jgi:hypothetical protein
MAVVPAGVLRLMLLRVVEGCLTIGLTGMQGGNGSLEGLMVEVLIVLCPRGVLADLGGGPVAEPLVPWQWWRSL